MGAYGFDFRHCADIMRPLKTTTFTRFVALYLGKQRKRRPCAVRTYKTVYHTLEYRLWPVANG